MKDDFQCTAYQLRRRLSATPLLGFALTSLVIIFAVARSTPAQTAATHSLSDPPVNSEGIQKGWNEFGIWGAISFDATTLIGKTPDAKFGNVGLRYGRVLAASKTVAFEWTIDAVPLAILSNDRYTLVPVSPGVFSVQKTRKSVYAWGLSPIGLKFNFRRQHRVQPFGSGTAGFLRFQEDVPVSGARRFNFTYDFGGGVQVVNRSRRAFTIGYKYQHISNGYRALYNPGVDVQMVYAGFAIFK